MSRTRKTNDDDAQRPRGYAARREKMRCACGNKLSLARMSVGVCPICEENSAVYAAARETQPHTRENLK